MPVKNQFHSPNSTFRKTLQVLITLEVNQQTKPARFSTELFVTSTSWYEKQLKTPNDRQKVYYICGIRETLYHGSKKSFWNKYQAYFADNAEEEKARVG